MRGTVARGLLGTLLLGACAWSGPSAVPAAFLEPGASAAPSASPRQRRRRPRPPSRSPRLPRLPIAPSPDASHGATRTPTPTPPIPRSSEPIRRTELGPSTAAKLVSAGRYCRSTRSRSSVSWRIPAGEDHIDATFQVVDDRRHAVALHAHPRLRPGSSGRGSRPLMLWSRTSSQVVALYDGFHRIGLACPSSAGTLRDEWEILARDNLPERCLGFEFAGGPLSFTTLDELESGMIGNVGGCVTTVRSARLGGRQLPVRRHIQRGVAGAARRPGDERDVLRDRGRHAEQALGTERHPGQRKGCRADRHRVGRTTRTRTATSCATIELMGDQLRFEVFHMHEYGPLTFELHRTGG